MRRWVLTVACGLIVAAVACACAGFGAQAVAQPLDAEVPTLVYDAREQAFSYRGTEGTDLLAVPGELMPGDEVVCPLRVEVRHADDPVTVYVRAAYEPGEVAGIEGVSVASAWGSAEPLSGTLGDAHGMRGAVKLATVDGSATVPAQVTISVPVTLDASTAGLDHVLTWEFIAQHEGGGAVVYAGAEGLPQTGDATWAACAAACVLGAACLLVACRRN